MRTVALRTSIALFLAVSHLIAEKTYPVDGIVVSLNVDEQILLVSHRPIPKLMGAMAMPFRVANVAEMANLRPGDRVEFELVVGKNKSMIRHIRKTAASEILIPVPANRVSAGAHVPDFTLTDQMSRTVKLSDFRGKVVVVNFLYTRCPLPDVCPRLAANFATVQKRFNRVFGSELVLLSITVDPEYDTPAVLLDYAQRWRADARGWHFLTGPLPEIERVSGLFGLVSWAEEGTLSHNSSTAVLSREGNLAAIVEGSTYRIEQLCDLIKQQLGGGK